MTHNELITTWFEQIWNKSDETVLHQILCDPFQFHLPGNNTLTLSLEDYQKELLAWHKRFQGADFKIQQTLSEGYQCVARYTCEATYHGGWINVPGNGQSVSMTGMLWFQVKDEKISDLWLEDSDFDLYQQLTGKLE